MVDSTSNPLQQRIQALYERVLADTDAAAPSDARSLELRLRVLQLANPLIRPDVDDEEHDPRSDVVVIN